MNESNILLYDTDEGKINVDVIIRDYMTMFFCNRCRCDKKSQV